MVELFQAGVLVWCPKNNWTTQCFGFRVRGRVNATPLFSLLQAFLVLQLVIH
jgi:hypothetical protein